MPLALLIFGVAFAAICILLTARIVNRQRWAKWSLAGVIGVLLLYAVSFGPACWISSHLGDGRFVSAMYQPVFRFWWNDGAPDWNDRLHRYMRCRANQDWNVVLEAKLCGKPSVVFPTGGLPELIEHGVDGYICRDCTVEALGDGIDYFVKNPDARYASGKAARRSLEEKFGQQRFRHEWSEAFLTTARQPASMSDG